MQNFSAYLQKRLGLLFGIDFVQLPPTVQLFPRKWSVSDMGGPKTATVNATGTPEDLAYLLTWLGDRLVINNEMGSAVWWGVVYEIEVTLGNITVSLSLETVYNRIAVIYPFTLPDGSTESRKTTWAADENSISRYGERQMLYSLPEGIEQNAETVRDRMLAQYADPAPVISTSSSNKFGAKLFCRGHWAMLDFVYWTNSKGLVSHEEFGGGVQMIGAAITDTTISFGTPAQPPGDGGTDYIKDSANRFGPLVEGTVIKVSGAAQSANNGVVTVQHQHGINIIETVENTQVDENAGATVTIALGEFGRVGWAAQSFTIPTATGWMPTRMAFRVQKIGNPADDLTYRIKANSSGSPASGEGTTLALGTIAGASVPTALNWVELAITPQDVEVGAGVTLWSGFAPGTTYWAEIGRSGAPSLSDYYIVAVDEDLSYSGGTMKVFTGAVGYGGSWVTRDPDADMPFRIIGEVDSITQMRSALGMAPEFLTVMPSPKSSGMLVRSYRSDDRNIMDEVMDMIDLGTSTGERLITSVDIDRNVIIQTVPTDVNPVFGMDGKLRHASGAIWEPGMLVAGCWVDIDALPVLDGLTRLKGQPTIYIQESEYDPQTDRLTLKSEGSLDPWQAIRWEKR